MYFGNSNRQISDSEAKQVEAQNKSIWDAFWSKPRSERTSADWESLLDIEIMVKA